MVYFVQYKIMKKEINYSYQDCLVERLKMNFDYIQNIITK